MDGAFVTPKSARNNLPAPFTEFALEVANTITLDGDKVYTRHDSELLAELLSYDRPSLYATDPFYWAWFNARRCLSYAIWDSFIGTVFALHDTAGTTALAKKGLVTGQVQPGILKELHTLYHAIAPKPFDGDDIATGYFFDPNMTGPVSQERDVANDWRKPTPQLLKALEHWVNTLNPSLEAIMGHPFSITTVRLFSLKPSPHTLGANNWHLDQWPIGIKKLQMYLEPTGAKEGSTEFRLKDGTSTHIEGSAGMWGIFENSTVYHRALPPKRQPRPTIELSLTPALKTDTRCVDAGINAGHWWFPPEFSALGQEEPDMYVKSVEIKLYLRALHVALGTVPPAEYIPPRRDKLGPIGEMTSPDVAMLRQEVTKLAWHLENMKVSTSWKVTRPLRALMTFLRALRS
jgi:hypothetical protein